MGTPVESHRTCREVELRLRMRSLQPPLTDKVTGRGKVIHPLGARPCRLPINLVYRESALTRRLIIAIVPLGLLGSITFRFSREEIIVDRCLS